MAERGYDLILVARRRDRLEGVAKRIQIKAKRTVEIVIADLADAKDLLRMIRVWRRQLK
jgi:short-subunit dehydrogenase